MLENKFLMQIDTLVLYILFVTIIFFENGTILVYIILKTK